MNVQEFIYEFGEYVRMYKVYNNGVIMFKFDQWENVMWLKQEVCEKMDMKVKDSSNYGPCYWFEPIEDN